MYSKMVKLNCLTLGELENEPIFKCSFIQYVCDFVCGLDIHLKVKTAVCMPPSQAGRPSPGSISKPSLPTLSKKVCV